MSDFLWDTLPRDMHGEIHCHLNQPDVLLASFVSRAWNAYFKPLVVKKTRTEWWENVGPHGALRLMDWLHFTCRWPGLSYRIYSIYLDAIRYNHRHMLDAIDVRVDNPNFGVLQIRYGGWSVLERPASLMTLATLVGEYADRVLIQRFLGMFESHHVLHHVFEELIMHEHWDIIVEILASMASLSVARMLLKVSPTLKKAMRDELAEREDMQMLRWKLYHGLDPLLLQAQRRQEKIESRDFLLKSVFDL